MAGSAGAAAEGRLPTVEGARPTRLTGTIGWQNRADPNDRASGVVMDTMLRFRNNPAP
jgi:hypothetical protein